MFALPEKMRCMSWRQSVTFAIAFWSVGLLFQLSSRWLELDSFANSCDYNGNIPLLLALMCFAAGCFCGLPICAAAQKPDGKHLPLALLGASYPFILFYAFAPIAGKLLNLMHRSPIDVSSSIISIALLCALALAPFLELTFQKEDESQVKPSLKAIFLSVFAIELCFISLLNLLGIKAGKSGIDILIQYKMPPFPDEGHMYCITMLFIPPPPSLQLLWHTSLGVFILYLGTAILPLVSFACVLLNRLKYSALFALLAWTFLAGHMGFWLFDSSELNSVPGATLNPLTKASSAGQLESVRAMVSKGWDVNQKDKAGGVPLVYACMNGDYDIAKFLLEKGADPNLKTKYFDTPLLCAVLGGNKDIVELLIKAGANVNGKGDSGETPLIRAAYGKQKIVDVLIKNGADINAKDGHGETAIKRATRKNEKAIMEMLKAAGAKE